MTTATVTQLPINPLVSYDPKSMEVSNTRWSRLWAIAAVVSAVAFIAIASLGFAYTTLYFESQLPLVAILIFAIGMPSSFRAFNYMWKKSESYAEEAKIDNKMITQMKDIDVEAQLSRLGVTPETTTADTKSLLARYTYCQDRKEELLEKAESVKKTFEISLEDRVHRVNPADYTIEKVDFSNPQEAALFREVQASRAAREFLIHRAAIYQLKSAYYLLVLKNAHEGRNETEFLQFVDVTLRYRLIAKEYGDGSSKVLIKTENGNYTAQDILNRSTYKLAREIFGLPRYGLLG